MEFDPDLSRATPPRFRSGVGALLHNLLCGLGLLLLLPRAGRLRGGVLQLLFGMLLVLLAGIGTEWWWTEGDLLFKDEVIPNVVCTYALLALVGYVCDRRLGRSRLSAWLPLAGMLVSIWLTVLSLLLWRLELLGNWHWSEAFWDDLYWGLLAWWGLALLAGGWRLLVQSSAVEQQSGRPWRQGGAVVLCLILVLVYKQHFAAIHYWQPDSNSNDDAGSLASPPADEALMYRQLPLLDAALARLQPQRPGRPDLYFLGVAGDANEPVFQREVQQVGQLMEQRFGTRGRSILLSNYVDTNRELPLATHTSMQSALQRIGQLMDSREDIAFIYLSSHGSHEHQFVLDYDPLPIDWLTPEQLASMIRQSGIGYRVVVVSSCYSGGFIPALRDPRALVMTAADANSSSFGCGDDTDFTWFGRALFDRALRHEDSLVTAFHQASSDIAAWERRDGYQPSHPQLWVGAQFQEHWQAYLAQLRH